MSELQSYIKYVDKILESYKSADEKAIELFRLGMHGEDAVMALVMKIISTATIDKLRAVCTNGDVSS
jgi:hypothetical protein